MAGGNDDRFPLLANRLKNRLLSRELSICLRVTWAATTELAFVAQAAGFDALYVDLEHSACSVTDAARLCSTALALGVTPLVRLPPGDFGAAVPLLDAGCQGIIAPHIETAAQARRFVQACAFPPLGRRTPVGSSLHMGYRSVPPAELASRLNGALLLCVMLENEAAVAAAEQIAAVQGVDLLLVGTQDLTWALGVPGQVDHPLVRACYERVAAACHAAATPFGVAGVADLGTVARYIDLGACFVSAGSDVDLLRSAATSRAWELRQAQTQAQADSPAQADDGGNP